MMTLSPYFIHRVNGERQTARSRSGSALVIVLGMLSVLLLMGVAFSVTMRTERSGAANMRHAAMARHILDSAIARTMSDLDAILREDPKDNDDNETFDPPSPTNLVVAVSGTGKSDLVVNVLSHEAARHLPGDQLAATLNASAEWLPIYGDVRISTTSDQDPTSEDAPVGRYAYVILNGCGNLDPNVVNSTNRLFGMTPAEIQIGASEDPTRPDSGKILGESGARTAREFRETRDDNGHYVNMRDFLRPEMVEDVLNYTELNLTSSKPTFPTNCFTIGSMAVDDLTPSLGTDDDDSRGKKPKVHIRLPKCPLADDEGRPIQPESLSSDEMSLIAEYFSYAISPTQRFRGADELPPNYTMHTDRVPYHALIARNLMDALDRDTIPGGSQPHSRAKINRGDYDPYVTKMGFSRMNWDRFPCTEPIPMLDNIVLVAGAGPGKPALELTPNHSELPDGTQGPVTNVSATLRVGLFPNSAIYSGWNVPKGSEGTYGYTWEFSGGIDLFYWTSDDNKEDFQRPFEAGAARASFQSPKGTFQLDSSTLPSEPLMRHPGDFVPAFEIQFTIENVSSVEDAKAKIPDDFGFAVHATGFLYKGSDEKSDIRQVAPCLAGNDSGDDIKNQDSRVDIDLWFQKSHLISPKDDNAHIVGAAYCVDPMFACLKDSWISSLSPDAQGGTSPEERLRDAITIHDEDNFAVKNNYAESVNPLAELYLKNPRKRLGTSTVFGVLKENGTLKGGCCDVMWGNPAPNGDEFPNDRCDKVKDAARAFYLDPAETDRTSATAFTRVGQLGFLPIGTYRTIALLDGWGTTSGGEVTRVSRQRVLDYFTMHPPRDPGTSGSGTRSGKPVKTATFTSRVNINPPRTIARRIRTGDGRTSFTLDTDDFNPKPLTAVLNGCPLREWERSGSSQKPVKWETAELIADGFLEAIDPQSGSSFDDSVTDEPTDWNAEGIVHDISVLGRCVPDDLSLSIDGIVRNETTSTCDFDREGIIRNTSEMLTARQQIFTILLKADSFTPKFGYNDAEHGTSLASVHAIAHVWRDPEPLRDADGLAVRDRDGNPIYPWVLLDMYQF